MHRESMFAGGAWWEHWKVIRVACLDYGTIAGVHFQLAFSYRLGSLARDIAATFRISQFASDSPSCLLRIYRFHLTKIGGETKPDLKKIVFWDFLRATAWHFLLPPYSTCTQSIKIFEFNNRAKRRLLAKQGKRTSWNGCRGNGSVVLSSVVASNRN